MSCFLRTTLGAERGKRLVSASALADMAVCERRLRLQATLGVRRTAEQELAARRGIVRHQLFLRDARLVQPKLQTSLPRHAGLVDWLRRLLLLVLRAVGLARR